MDLQEKRELRKFLGRLALFSLPLLLAAGALELGLYRVVSYYQRKSASFDRQLANMELLVLGTSQADYGIDPEAFARPAFNLAMPSQSPVVDAQLVARYLPQLSRLKTVILPIDYFTVAHLNAGGIEHWRNHYYIRYFGIAGDGGWRDRWSIRNYSLLALYTPRVALDFALQGFQVNMALPQHDSGWDEQGEGLQAPPAAEEISALLARQHSMMSLAFVERNRAALDGMIRALRARGVKVLLVSLPISSGYRAALEGRYVAAQDDTVAAFRARFGLPYFDHRSDPRFETRDFLDPDHLSGPGARKFSRILAKEVEDWAHSRN
jgi:hypothetical protein